MTDTEITGLIPDEVGDVLYTLAAQVPEDEAVVELGSFEGKSTGYLAQGVRDGHGAKLFAVDLWDDERNISGKHNFTDPEHRVRFEQHLRDLKVWGRVDAIQASTTEAAEHYSGPPVGLLFVDADHEEASVRADVEAWRSHLSDDAVIVFDDYGTRRNPGVAIVAHSIGTPRIEAGRLAIVHLVNGRPH